MKKILLFLSAMLLAIFLATSRSSAVTPTEILLPLYNYPNHYNPATYVWKRVASANIHVPITAIINPNNGPNNAPPNQDYVQGLKDLRAAKVKVLGYVYTGYGKRSLTEIKTDIDCYAKFYELDGIFLDEGASQPEFLNFYQEIYTYIKQKPGLSKVILNQGTYGDEGYVSRPVADTVVIFENYSKQWSPYTPHPYVAKYPPDRFSVLIHSTPDAATMQKQIDRAIARNVKYLYITNLSPDTGTRNPWDNLPAYWDSEIDYLKQLNVGKTGV
jgi:Spherulation-specific family 4